MAKTLYLECSSGISGDMTAAALLDLGASEEAVLRALNSLPVQGFEVRISRVVKSGLDVCDFDVVLDDEHENYDHDMAYLHGEEMHEHHHSHDQHSHHHAHIHEHTHVHNQHHEHRDMAEISAIINATDMTESAKEIAHNIFFIIAEAEAKAHGIPVHEVHFHEVGAIDSIADVVAIAVAFDDLAPDEVIVTELAEGQGTVRCQHGIIPVPCPAVVNIAAAHNIALRILDVRGELVTPTGAAVVAAIRTQDKLPEKFTIKKVGMGAGKREYKTPGILRALLIEEN